MNFELVFKVLTGYDPLRWQSRLFYEHFLSGTLPEVCDLPTGLGKTSVIPIWLIALVTQIHAGQQITLPRRLVYVVNRRTVVDQATDVCMELRKRIGDDAHESDELKWMHDVLSESRALLSGPILAISTLRGELADNEEWKVDPSRPAIIVGTVDMIGSKLLFRGYGDSYKVRPHHTGLIGQDALFVHDEAHLTPAFGELLHAVAKEQRNACEPKPIKVLELSATSRSNTREKFSLTNEDALDPIVKQRINSEKQLSIHFVPDRKHSLAKITDLALFHEDKVCKVLIYVYAPSDAKQIVSALKQKLGVKAADRIALLTGTMRGYERDRMVKENRVYQAMLDPKLPADKSVYLVSTSAGEVGIDIDADHLVCDLSTLDSMIQRLGRVNRRGGADRIADIDVVAIESPADPKKQTENKLDKVKTATAQALQSLPVTNNQKRMANPLTMRQLIRDWPDATLPPPVSLPTTDILFDAWALTSGKQGLATAPDVAPYLHGLESAEPETYVAWRAEVSLLSEALVDEETLQGWFEHCRVESQERLCEPTYQIKDEVKRFAQKWPNAPAVLISGDGVAQLLTLQKLSDMANARFSTLAYATVVLPTSVGGLSPEGLLDSAHEDPVLDVAETQGQRERRILIRKGDETETITLLEYGREKANAASAIPSNTDLNAIRSNRRSRWSLVQKINLNSANAEFDDEIAQLYLVLFVEPKRATLESPDAASFEKPPTVDEHCDLAEKWARRFATTLQFAPEIAEAIAIAARWHDRGKDRKIWQQSIYNFSEVPFAKSGPKGMDWRVLGGYRHELGSLLEAMSNAEITQHPECDLILHLIAVHHGWSRPHFLMNAYDREFPTLENERAVHEAMRRYGRLQLRFGRWGLAWLECFIRSSDVLSSHQIAVQSSSNEPEGAIHE